MPVILLLADRCEKNRKQTSLSADLIFCSQSSQDWIWKAPNGRPVPGTRADAVSFTKEADRLRLTGTNQSGQNPLDLASFFFPSAGVAGRTQKSSTAGPEEPEAIIRVGHNWASLQGKLSCASQWPKSVCPFYLFMQQTFIIHSLHKHLVSTYCLPIVPPLGTQEELVKHPQNFTELLSCYPSAGACACP